MKNKNEIIRAGRFYCRRERLYGRRPDAGGDKNGLRRQVPASARRILPAAISRRAMTIARLSDSKSGFAPFKSCFALFAASTTSSKRLGMCVKQSSTVILAIASMLARRIKLNKSRFSKVQPIVPELPVE